MARTHTPTTFGKIIETDDFGEVPHRILTMLRSLNVSPDDFNSILVFGLGTEEPDGEDWHRIEGHLVKHSEGKMYQAPWPMTPIPH